MWRKTASCSAVISRSLSSTRIILSEDMFLLEINGLTVFQKDFIFRYTAFRRRCCALVANKFLFSSLLFWRKHFLNLLHNCFENFTINKRLIISTQICVVCKMHTYVKPAADLVTFAEEILNGKLHFLCSELYKRERVSFSNSFQISHHFFSTELLLNAISNKTWFSFLKMNFYLCFH